MEEKVDELDFSTRSANIMFCCKKRMMKGFSEVKDKQYDLHFGSCLVFNF